MFDLQQELQEYRVINLRDIAQDETEIPDNIRNSIFLYNKAIESLRSGSEDIAIIELKKAVSMNPRFYEAVNLLGICYSYTGDKERAAEAFEKVVKAEQNSVRALRYLSILSLENDGTVKAKPRKKPPAPAINKTKAPENINSVNPGKVLLNNWTKYLAFLAAGILLAVAFQAIFARPLNKPEDQTGNNVVEADNSTQEIQKKYDELLPKYELLQKDKDAANKTADYYKSVIKLYQIENLARDKKYESAADMLLLMKTAGFTGEDKTKLDSLYKTVMPSAALAVYNEGYKLYNTKKYQEALKKFEKVEVYDPGFTRLDAVLYYMGRSSQQLNDSRNAIVFFQKLIDKYPKSSYAVNAKVRIKSLTELP